VKKILDFIIKDSSAMRYVGSAIFATIADLGIFYIMHKFIEESIAYTASFCISVSLRFLVDKFWTFKSAHNSKKTTKQFLNYWLISLLSLVLGWLFFYGFRIIGFGPLISKISSVPGTTILTFLGFKLWVFGSKNHYIPTRLRQ
jgi:putative flippase GtrA